MVTPRTAASDLCPFIDDNDARCASHFTLDHLSEAFACCVGGYRGCPQYYRIARQQPHRLVALTSHGRALQPTGT